MSEGVSEEAVCVTFTVVAIHGVGEVCNSITIIPPQSRARHRWDF